MLGIVTALIISWIILHLFDKKSILSLGFLPLSRRMKQFGIGFMITAFLCLSVELIELLLKSSNLYFNKEYSFRLFTSMFFWDLKSVITEELIFRGAILLILIERIGIKAGLLISATAFGIFGNIFPMIVVLIGTGIMGYAWSLSFYKTKSILMPIGLHLGWNFTFNTIFSKGPLGAGFLISEGGRTLSDWFSLVGLWIVPVIVLLIIKYWIPTETNLSNNEDLKTSTSNS
ncbi:MAG: CPBP family intramembrane metalloprotease [Bacteroidetes bacterium]|nr:CPBP family intramembrane metalloprotease [Bacteroidota bacterium]NCQ10635.1 CPBP family intramembrane metalloprotease [Bacteroidota bacterium]